MVTDMSNHTTTTNRDAIGEFGNVGQYTMMFKDMTDSELRAAYADWRALMLNASEGRMARSMGRCLRNVEIIEAIADRRGIALTGGAA